MKVSIFTPTHNPSYLLDVYASIKDQGFDEWVIVPNGSCLVGDIPSEISADPRVVIAPTESTGVVGALKRFACSQCTGDILVECDHDDMLIEPAIAEVRKAFQSSNVVLAYSNCAEFNQSDGASREFGPGYGWEYRDFSHRGTKYREIVSPSDHPSNASIIYYSPNHLRAFRREAYEAAGGHDPSMKILDDQDLMSRLYCVGQFHHIDKCCYLYRVTGDNTWLEHNNEIQANVLNSRRKYLPAMAEAWARRRGLRMLDLGGRFGDAGPGYECVDINGTSGIKADLRERYPFEDNSVGIVRAHDFMEHVADKQHTMSEIHRILAPGGMLLSETPSTCGPNGESGQGAFQDPTHVSYWNKNSFWYYTNAQRARYIDNTRVRFMDALTENHFPTPWHRYHHIPYVRADLVCLKKDENGRELVRPHGLIEI